MAELFNLGTIGITLEFFFIESDAVAQLGSWLAQILELLLIILGVFSFHSELGTTYATSLGGCETKFTQLSCKVLMTLIAPFNRYGASPLNQAKKLRKNNIFLSGKLNIHMKCGRSLM